MTREPRSMKFQFSPRRQFLRTAALGSSAMLLSFALVTENTVGLTARRPESPLPAQRGEGCLQKVEAASGQCVPSRPLFPLLRREEIIPGTYSRIEPLNLRARFSPSPPDAGRRRGLGRGGAITLDSPPLGPLPTRPSWGEEVTPQVGGRFMEWEQPQPSLAASKAVG